MVKKYECFAVSQLHGSATKICETTSLVESRKRAMKYARTYEGRRYRFFEVGGPEVGSMQQLINDEFVWLDYRTDRASMVQKDGRLGRRA